MFGRPQKQLLEAVCAHFAGCCVAATLVFAIPNMASTLMMAATPLRILTLVLGPVNRKDALRALGHVESIWMRLAPGLEGIMSCGV